MAAAATKKRPKRPERKQKAGFEINGKFYDSVDTYTVDEAIKLCEIAGVDTLLEFAFLSTYDPRCMKALIWLVKHRENPELTADDIGALKIKSWKPIQPEIEEENEEGEAGPPAGSSHGSEAATEPSKS